MGSIRIEVGGGVIRRQFSVIRKSGEKEDVQLFPIALGPKPAQTGLSALPSGFAGTQGGDAEGGALDVHGDTREAGQSKAAEGGGGSHRHEGAFVMADAMQPAVANLESEKHSAGAQDAVEFLEGTILLFA